MQTNNPTCYLLIGLPGSGKSKIAQEIITQYPDIEYISSDQYIDKMAQENNLTYTQSYREYIEKAQKWVNQQVQIAIKNKKSMIWDQTNIVKSARRKKIITLNPNKYEIIGLSMELSNEELIFRNKKRINEGGKRISHKIINDMINQYERPTYEEGFSQIYLIHDDGQLQLMTKEISANKLKL